ncbi:uncharacterized protein EI90DRAFT_967426 [Cantharellus anzutake]|uniref:uncharacterized protein n=1 Tax=Cantharellus anzutake TaxID=1750568 RepID=UPI0019057507|nr:uncharacterized protein EI90DRAFT_967426 [Cantharellus anzutake]KAF8311531.1 hypothetical protein EI90DRAFT_967426 [Cantharellus anzutake]
MKAYDENEAVQTIISLGISHSEAAIRNALRQYNGDLDRAASALMTESEDVNDMPALEPLVSDSSKSQTSKSVAPPPSIVVDLTGEDEEDEELKKALSLSMSDSIEHKHKEWGVPSSQAQTAKFGPSTREDTDGSWAVVPSSLNDNKRPSPDDADLQRAMAASLQTSFARHSPFGQSFGTSSCVDSRICPVFYA